VTVICGLLLASRLVYCFTYLLTGTAANVYVEPHSTDAAAFHGEENLRIKESELGARGWGRNAKASDEDDDELEPELENREKVADDNEDVNEGRRDDVDSEKIAEVEEIWNDEKKISEEMAKIAGNDDQKISDETVTVPEGDEKDDSEETIARPEDEDEGTAGKRKLTDAVAYLERLAGDIAKTGQWHDIRRTFLHSVCGCLRIKENRNLIIFQSSYDVYLQLEHNIFRKRR